MSTPAGPGWAWLLVWIDLDDWLIHSMVGPAGATREHARAVVQEGLDGDPSLAPIAAAWRTGQVKDDTVYAGLRTWAIIAHNGDPELAAWEWIDDYAATMRAAGVDARIAKRPHRPEPA